MTMMMGNLYKALKVAGADDESARQAAEEVASHEHRFAKIESDMNLLKWMVGFNLAMTAAVLAKMLV